MSAYHFNSFEGLEEEQDTIKKDTSDDDIESASEFKEEELMSKIETLQKTVTTSFTLQISERDKLNELQHNLYMKGN